MSVTDDEEVQAASPARRRRKPRPDTWSVKTHDPDFLGNNRGVFKDSSPDAERLAKAYIVQRHPRGREVYLESPAGETWHYSADLAAQGHENDGWLEYSEDEED
jgi:hypothetical protein